MKKLIICSDGTWDEPTGPASNVVKLARGKLHRSCRRPVGSLGPGTGKDPFIGLRAGGALRVGV